MLQTHASVMTLRSFALLLVAVAAALLSTAATVASAAPTLQEQVQASLRARGAHEGTQELTHNAGKKKEGPCR
jgi:hypothetical protein